MADTTTDTGLIPEAIDALGLDGSLFMPAEDYPVWQYTGPLDDAREWFEETTETQMELSRDGIFTLTSFLHEHSLFWPQPVSDAQIIKAYEDVSYAETSAHGYEEVWRNHLGELLLKSGQPYADIGVHGETLEQLQALIRDFDRDEPDYSRPKNPAEHELYDRWLSTVIQHGEVMGYRAWVRDMSRRG